MRDHNRMVRVGIAWEQFRLPDSDSYIGDKTRAAVIVIIIREPCHLVNESHLIMLSFQ